MSEMSPAPPRPARLSDVAREAGVHVSTASRILNGTGELTVRPETRQRILDTAERLRYRPNAIARSLKSSSAGAIGLLIPSLRNPVLSEITRGAFDRAWERGYVVVLAEDGENGQALSAYERLVGEGRIDGLLVGSARPGSPLLEAFADNHVPCVFVNRRLPGSHRNVSMREEEAGSIAAEHLIALGHRHLAHLAGPLGLDTAARRRDGFVAAAVAAGLDVIVEEAPFEERGGFDAAQRLLSRDPRPTGMFVSNINQAVGAIAGARRLGLRLPGEVSIVGYDDDPVGEFLEPPLTAIAMPLHRLGSTAVDALIDQIEGTPPKDVVLRAPPRLVLRGSTTTAPGAKPVLGSPTGTSDQARSPSETASSERA